MSATILILPFIRRSHWADTDTSPSEIDPIDWTPARPVDLSRLVIRPRPRILSDDDFHGGGDAA